MATPIGNYIPGPSFLKKNEISEIHGKIPILVF